MEPHFSVWLDRLDRPFRADRSDHSDHSDHSDRDQRHSKRHSKDHAKDSSEAWRYGALAHLYARRKIHPASRRKSSIDRQPSHPSLAWSKNVAARFCYTPTAKGLLLWKLLLTRNRFSLKKHHCRGRLGSPASTLLGPLDSGM